MSAPPNFTNFAFRCGQGVPSDWTEAHAHSLYDSIVADPIQRTKNAWTPAHIRWMMKSIWFCDKIAQLSQVTGVDVSILRHQRTAVFRQICPFVQWFCHASIQKNAVCSPSFWWDLSNLVGKYWLATSDPVSSDADTGPSDMEGDGDEDTGYGVAQPPTTLMDVDPPVPEGEPDRNETGKEWWVASETASSDDGSGEDKGEVEEEVKPKRKSSADRKEEEKDHNADDKREEEEEVDELEGGEASNAAPVLKKKGYKCTSWLVDLNQRLRQGKTQPAMCAYMVEMEEEGVLEPVDEKCSRCHGGCCCLLPIDSDNGHPACTECLISSHGCPNRVACATPAKKKATRSDKGKGKVGPAPVKCPQAFILPEAGPSNMPTALDFMVEFQSFCSHPMQEKPPTGHNPVTDFAFNLVEHCLGGMTHPREAAWDRILALTHQLIAAHHALKYELRRSGPFSAEEVEYLLQTRYPDSMLPLDDEHNEGST
ncbi:hypothetical protein ARMGADRAFT_1083353 [Armillaria gallica]|uniref:Uncharacterized protein n=1 Tax=Armillaria gallica TaxID=47427 RepID=A0A2H3D3L5_ARMGA|nr:hypothetical protein ARMGADRAFT_1083353 [Armillaria gallica]